MRKLRFALLIALCPPLLISHNSKTTAPRKTIFTSINSATQVSYPCSIHYVALTAIFFELFSKNCFYPFLLAILLWIKGILSRPHIWPIGGRTWPKACPKREIYFDFWVDTTLTQVTYDSTIATTATLHCMGGCKAWKWLLLLTPYHFKSCYCKSNKDVIFYFAVCNVAHDKCDYCSNFHPWLLFSLY